MGFCGGHTRAFKTSPCSDQENSINRSLGSDATLKRCAGACLRPGQCTCNIIKQVILWRLTVILRVRLLEKESE